MVISEACHELGITLTDLRTFARAFNKTEQDTCDLLVVESRKRGRKPIAPTTQAIAAPSPSPTAQAHVAAPYPKPKPDAPSCRLVAGVVGVQLDKYGKQVGDPDPTPCVRVFAPTAKGRPDACFHATATLAAAEHWVRSHGWKLRHESERPWENQFKNDKALDGFVGSYEARDDGTRFVPKPYEHEIIPGHVDMLDKACRIQDWM